MIFNTTDPETRQRRKVRVEPYDWQRGVAFDIVGRAYQNITPDSAIEIGMGLIEAGLQAKFGSQS